MLDAEISSGDKFAVVTSQCVTQSIRDNDQNDMILRVIF
jgi:hypothetical protein